MEKKKLSEIKKLQSQIKGKRFNLMRCDMQPNARMLETFSFSILHFLIITSPVSSTEKLFRICTMVVKIIKFYLLYQETELFVRTSLKVDVHQS